MRKSLRAGYSRATLEARLEEVYRHCRASLEKWAPGETLQGARACQELMSVQVSQLMVGVDASDYEMGFNPFPTSAPNGKFRFTIDNRRHDI